MIDLSPLTGKTVIVTGSTGFLGGALRRSLETVDAFRYYPTHAALGRETLPSADYIIHAAGYAAPSKFLEDPIGTIRINTEAVVDLMQSLKPGGSFLFCSSCEIYKGMPSFANEYQIGNTTPLHPRACYIEGKRCGETIINAYRSSGIRAMSARIALAYGPGTKKHDARVLNQFVEKALTTGKIELIDDGAVTVSYCYIDDMIDMMWNTLLNGTQPVYNLGGISDTTIANLAMRIAAQTGAKVSIPAGPRGIPQGRMELYRYWKEFGKPTYMPFDDGLRLTIEYQRGLYDA